MPGCDVEKVDGRKLALPAAAAADADPGKQAGQPSRRLNERRKGMSGL